MISLGYYLRVVAAIWMGGERARITLRLPEPRLAPIAGGAPEADEDDGPEPDQDGEPEAGADDEPEADESETAGSDASAAPAHDHELTAVAVVFAAACIFFGFFPQPLFELAAHAGAALTGIF